MVTGYPRQCLTCASTQCAVGRCHTGVLAVLGALKDRTPQAGDRGAEQPWVCWWHRAGSSHVPMPAGGSGRSEVLLTAMIISRVLTICCGELPGRGAFWLGAEWAGA